MRQVHVKSAAQMREQREPEQTERQHGRFVSPLVGDGARVLITAAAAFLVLFALKYMRDFALPIVLAVFLAIASYPLTYVLKRHARFPHWLAVTVSVLVDLGLAFGFFSLVRILAADVLETLRSNILQQLASKYALCLSTLDQWGMGAYARELFKSPASLIDTQYIISLTQSFTARVISFMSVTVLVLLLMTFMLAEAPLFIRNVSRLPGTEQAKRKLVTVIKDVQRYLLIKTVASVCTGLLAWWLCSAMAVPFAFLWGVVACVLNFIPTIGSIVASLPPILLALALQDWGSVLIVAGGYAGINFTIGNCIEPIFLGRQFGIATTVVLLSVIVWGWVWGPVGMLLAVPITMLIKLAFEDATDLRWLASIVDDKQTSENSKQN